MAEHATINGAARRRDPSYTLINHSEHPCPLGHTSDELAQHYTATMGCRVPQIERAGEVGIRTHDTAALKTRALDRIAELERRS
jgi:hypothetical protein